MNDQIRAAAERLRRIEIGDPFEDVYAGFGNFDGMTLRMLEDRTAVYGDFRSKGTVADYYSLIESKAQSALARKDASV